jgi:hypothetical protein
MPFSGHPLFRKILCIQTLILPVRSHNYNTIPVVDAVWLFFGAFPFDGNLA